MDTILEARQITKYFHNPLKVQVLNNITFSINKGEFVSVVGKSGCGKSTLLYVLSTMDTDYEGDLLIDNESMKLKREKQLAQVRNQKIGFVFQFHYLLPEFSVIKNVMLPALKLNQQTEKVIRVKAMEKLDRLGIAKLANQKANQLSGGEKQRVAIARALINEPHIIMADEPTGNLDKVNSAKVFDIFQNLATVHNQTILVVTHDPDFAHRSNRIIEMEDGKIIRQ